MTAPSWCYWCQVYESEDYLFHPELVPFINSETVPVYVDADNLDFHLLADSDCIDAGDPVELLASGGYTGGSTINIDSYNIRNKQIKQKWI